MTRPSHEPKSRKVVLLAITDTHHGFLKGAARYAKEHDWHLEANMIITAKIPIGWRGDGILSFIGYRNALADFILKSRIPTVELSLVRADIPLPRVCGDNTRIGQLAAEHFLERRFRQFAWAPLLGDRVGEERHAGFSARLATEGFSCHVLPPADSDTAGGTMDWSAQRALLRHELLRLPKPLAVFAYNDCVAAGIIDAALDAGLAVPESVAVLGVDNDTILAESSSVPISSVRHDLEEVAYQACILLDRLMKGQPAPPETIRVAPKGIVTRRSTEIVAVNDLRVARALRYIQDHHHHTALDVPAVCEFVRSSRRPLEKAFRKELGRTIHDEILRVRLDRCRHLLAHTAMPVHEVAAATGFARPNHLFRVFTRHTGLSPGRYRQSATV